MDTTAFKKLVLENFPTDLPNPSRLFEGIRVENGHEKLEFLSSVEWPELSLEMMSIVAGEFWQLSSVWMKYYFPAFMTLTADVELEVQLVGSGTHQIAEITNDNQDSLVDCIFGYWCGITNLVSANFNINENCFYGLTSKQADLVEIWLQRLDFKVLHRADIFPDDFDFSDEGLNKFITIMKKHSL